MKKLIFMLIMSSAFVSSCFSNKNNADSGKFKRIPINSLNPNVELPKELARLMEAHINFAEDKKKYEEEVSDKRLIFNKTRKLFPIKVYLSEAHKDVVSQKNIVLEITREGSVVDFKNYISKKRGSFKFKVQVSDVLNKKTKDRF